MTKKKSWLEKLKLVEVEEGFNQDELIESLQTQSQQMDAYIPPQEFSQAIYQFTEEDFLTVEEIYGKIEMSDLSKSIFKIEEFKKHFPDSLPSEVKRQTVIGILEAAGLSLEELIEDAEGRINALKGVSVVTNEKSNLVVMEKEEEIDSLLSKIDSLKQDNIDRKTAQEKQDSLIDEELDKIGQILKFISSK